MPCIQYRNLRFKPDVRRTIDRSNEVIAEYANEGFALTLRQLYYQFVSRDWIPNTQKSYKCLGDAINNGRLAGLIDWYAIEDRTRSTSRLNTWEGPENIIRACVEQFRLDAWAEQPNYVEVWIEKDALVGVIEGVCNELRVPFLSCRGYTSQSAMWLSAREMMRQRANGKEVHVLHFGDHDPSGIDMSRDIQERLEEFSEDEIEFHRLALNMPQIKRYNPPPNPAKVTDSRAGSYIAQFGRQSWELDALKPQVITKLVRDNVLKLRDEKLWQKVIDEEEKTKLDLGAVCDNWQGAVDGARKPVKKSRK